MRKDKSLSNCIGEKKVLAGIEQVGEDRISYSDRDGGNRTRERMSCQALVRIRRPWRGEFGKEMAGNAEKELARRDQASLHA